MEVPFGADGSLTAGWRGGTPPKSYLPQLVPLNEVLPYAGLPQASEIFHTALRCHAPASHYVVTLVVYSNNAKDQFSFKLVNRLRFKGREHRLRFKLVQLVQLSRLLELHQQGGGGRGGGGGTRRRVVLQRLHLTVHSPRPL